MSNEQLEKKLQIASASVKSFLKRSLESNTGEYGLITTKIRLKDRKSNNYSLDVFSSFESKNLSVPGFDVEKNKTLIEEGHAKLEKILLKPGQKPITFAHVRQLKRLNNNELLKESTALYRKELFESLENVSGRFKSKSKESLKNPSTQVQAYLQLLESHLLQLQQNEIYKVTYSSFDKKLSQLSDVVCDIKNSEKSIADCEFSEQIKGLLCLALAISYANQNEVIEDYFNKDNTSDRKNITTADVKRLLDRQALIVYEMNVYYQKYLDYTKVFTEDFENKFPLTFELVKTGECNLRFPLRNRLSGNITLNVIFAQCIVDEIVKKKEITEFGRKPVLFKHISE